MNPTKIEYNSIEFVFSLKKYIVCSSLFFNTIKKPKQKTYYMHWKFSGFAFIERLKQKTK
jgi:hypothetical protein